MFDYCGFMGLLSNALDKIALKKILSGVPGLIPSLNLRFLNTRGAPVPVKPIF